MIFALAFYCWQITATFAPLTDQRTLRRELPVRGEAGGSRGESPQRSVLGGLCEARLWGGGLWSSGRCDGERDVHTPCLVCVCVCMRCACVSGRVCVSTRVCSVYMSYVPM